MRCSARATAPPLQLIISDNASTDDTAEIRLRQTKQDTRIRYICQPRKIGATPKYNFVVEQARGELFKWAAADDLYGRDLLECRVDAIDQFPHVVLAHSWTALIDGSSRGDPEIEDPLATASCGRRTAFGACLTAKSGDDFSDYKGQGPPPTQCPHGSFHHGPHWSRIRLGWAVQPDPGLAVLPADILTEPSGTSHGTGTMREYRSTPGSRLRTRSSGSTPNTSGIHLGHPACAAVIRGPAGFIAIWRSGRLAGTLPGRTSRPGSQAPARSGHHYCEPPPSHSPSARPDRRFPNSSGIGPVRCFEQRSPLVGDLKGPRAQRQRAGDDVDRTAEAAPYDDPGPGVLRPRGHQDHRGPVLPLGQAADEFRFSASVPRVRIQADERHAVAWPPGTGPRTRAGPARLPAAAPGAAG